MTHYIPAFTERNGKDQRAVCGAWVRFPSHANEPTCAECKAYVEGPGQMTADDAFGPDVPVETIKSHEWGSR